MGTSRGVIGERTCIWGMGCSAAIVSLLNFMAGQWNLTKTVISLIFLALATAAPLLSHRWYLKIPIFLHIFRHAIPAVIIGAMAGALKRRRLVATGAVVAGAIPLMVLALTGVAYQKGAYDSPIPLWLYMTNWALGSIYWFCGAFYSGTILMGYLNRRTRAGGVSANR
ncbi:MAG: hypothetical protein P8165_15400 [Deltaproteobacteria bacterium]